MISSTVLLLCEDFSAALDASRVARSIARGIEAGERFTCDSCLLPRLPRDASSTPPSRRLDALDFEARMRASRALVIAMAALEDETLAGSITFEAATRARQSGVPAYAVTALHRLDPFEARIADLQVVLEASSPRALTTAARKLSALL